MSATDILEKAEVSLQIKPDVLEKLVNFFEVIAPISEQALFSHQVQSIESIINQKKHIVVTTGTGSGKSYCFLLPLLLNLAKEAVGDGHRKRWQGPSKEKRTTGGSKLTYLFKPREFRQIERLL
ncbi:MAG: DEAD/DEAH box helicase [Bdellovibrionales bacterium]|nr:DEAD/DEAH box helicase [Bdellovibrionales bacterium]